MSEALAKYNALPATLEEVQAYGALAKQAGIIPKEMNEIQASAIVQAGREMGLAPLQSLRTIFLVNGRLVMKAELMLALARKFAGVRVESIVDEEERCTVTLVRGEERITTTFSDEDAKRAGLVTPNSAWAKYPRIMRQWRCISAALRIIAPEVTLGFLTPEEAQSIAIEEVVEPAPSAEQEEAIDAEVSLPREYTPEEVKAKLLQLGFSNAERIALSGAIREAGVNPQSAAQHVMNAESREEALAELRRIGVRFPPSEVSAAAGT